jgi:hypothetical protein
LTDNLQQAKATLLSAKRLAEQQKDTVTLGSIIKLEEKF